MPVIAMEVLIMCGFWPCIQGQLFNTPIKQHNNQNILSLVKLPGFIYFRPEIEKVTNPPYDK